MTGIERAVAPRLAELEDVIERGLATFVEVGRALSEINETRLYREHGFDTFEDYVRERWELSRSRAYQLVDAAEVSTIVDVGNEAQARELAPLRPQPEKLTQAWTQAQERASSEGRKVTARDVSAAVVDIVTPTNGNGWAVSQPDIVSAAVPVDLASKRDRQIAEKARERIERAVGACSGQARGLRYLKPDQACAVATREEIEGWSEAIGEAIAALKQLRKRLDGA